MATIVQHLVRKHGKVDVATAMSSLLQEGQVGMRQMLLVGQEGRRSTNSTSSSLEFTRVLVTHKVATGIAGP